MEECKARGLKDEDYKNAIKNLLGKHLPMRTPEHIVSVIYVHYFFFLYLYIFL